MSPQKSVFDLFQAMARHKRRELRRLKRLGLTGEALWQYEQRVRSAQRLAKAARREVWRLRLVQLKALPGQIQQRLG